MNLEILDSWSNRSKNKVNEFGLPKKITVMNLEILDLN